MSSQDPAVLLEAEHAVARVLAQGPRLPRLYPRLLEAIGTALRSSTIDIERRMSATTGPNDPARSS